MFDEAEMKAILKRASELDASRDSAISHEELLEVARELGISGIAVNEAVAERVASGTPRLVPIRSPAPSSLRILGLSAAAGFMSALVTGGAMVNLMIGTPGETIAVTGTLTLAALIVTSGRLALSDSATSVWFLGRNVVLWFGAALGWSFSAALLQKYGMLEPNVNAMDLGATAALAAFLMTSVVGVGYQLMRRLL